MTPNRISPAEFSRLIGVSKPAITKAISTGRLPVYDEAGSRVSADYKGRKFIDPDEGRSAYKLSRARISDAELTETSASLDRELSIDPDDLSEVPTAAASPPGAALTLVGVKTDKEFLQSDLLRLRLARERGELISRQAQLDAMETAGRIIARDLQTIPFWTEEIESVIRSGGAPALMSWLRAKANQLCATLADKLTAGADDADVPIDPDIAL